MGKHIEQESYKSKLNKETGCLRFFGVQDNDWKLCGAYKNAVECKDCKYKKPHLLCNSEDIWECGLTPQQRWGMCRKVKISADEYFAMSEDEQRKWHIVEERHPSFIEIEWRGKD